MKAAISQQELPEVEEVFQNAQAIGRDIELMIKEKKLDATERHEMIHELEEIIYLLENLKRKIS